MSQETVPKTIVPSTLDTEILFRLEVIAVAAILASAQTSCRRPREGTKPAELRAMRVVSPQRKTAGTPSDHSAEGHLTPSVNLL